MSHKHTSTIFTYMVVWFVLMVLLLATVLAIEIDLDHMLFPGANISLAMFIAVVKALIVMLWFMHVKDASKLTWIFAGASFIWLGIMVLFTLQDYHTRGYFPGWENPVSESYTPAHIELANRQDMAAKGAHGGDPVIAGPESGTTHRP